MTDVVVVRMKEREARPGETKARCRACRVMVWVTTGDRREKERVAEGRFICNICAE